MERVRSTSTAPVYRQVYKYGGTKPPESDPNQDLILLRTYSRVAVFHYDYYRHASENTYSFSSSIGLKDPGIKFVPNSRYPVSRSTLRDEDIYEWAKSLDFGDPILRRFNPGASNILQLFESQDSSVCKDVVTPNFKKLSQSGSIINTPFSKRTVSTQAHHSIGEFDTYIEIKNFDVTSYTSGSTKYHELEVTYVIRAGRQSVGFTPAAVDRLRSSATLAVGSINPGVAINRAFGNLDSAEMDLLISLAESKKTIASVASASMRLANLARSIKKGKFKKLAPKTWRKFRKDLSKPGSIVRHSDYFLDAWMEARYAWRPLVYDVNNAIKVLNGEKDLSPRSTFRGGDNGSENGSIYLDFEVDGFRYVGDLNVTREWNVRAGVIGAPRFNGARAHQLGLFNVTTAAWDLVPYSFVIDWFLDVGGYLSTLNPNPIYQTLASWHTVSYNLTSFGTFEVTSPDGNKTSLSFRETITSKVRTPNSQRRFISPHVNLNVPKLVDAVALLRRFR